MFKKPTLILSLFVLSIWVSEMEFSESPSENRILEANLMAAIDLESNIISNCGTKTYSYKEEYVKAPLFDDLGTYSFAISFVSAKEAQTYFDQGMRLTFGFNHTEAHRSFKEAAKQSEDSPMPYWGQAYALGPNINDSGLDNERMNSAREAIDKALDRIDKTNPLERGLIKALDKRFVKNDEGLFELDNEAYRLEMEKMAKKYSKNPDILTLYAAAIMNTMPWNYWNRDMSPRENTVMAQEALERAIAIDSQHPGALHYSIHLNELPFPELAAKSGDGLAPLMPGAGHMVHMPSHAYVRVGRYKEAAEANIKAIAADEDYISQCYSQGIYPLGYYPHNIHFLWSAATLMGDSQTAIAAAKKTAEKVSVGELTNNTFMQEFAAIPMQAYVRFGKWNEILTIPYPGDHLKHLKLFWHYSRGIAFTRKGIYDQAQEELDSLKKITLDESYVELYATINNSKDVADIAFNIVSAELAAAQGNSEEAEASFKLAMENEDALTYTEPPSWHLSTRENYGAFLIREEKYKEAEEVYVENLKTLRSNGWSLIGLYHSYKGQGREGEAQETLVKFTESWKYADTKITSSAL